MCRTVCTSRNGPGTDASRLVGKRAKFCLANYALDCWYSAMALSAGAHIHPVFYKGVSDLRFVRLWRWVFLLILSVDLMSFVGTFGL